MLAIKLVGTFAITRDGLVLDRVELGSRKGRELLKLLTVQRHLTVSVATIGDVLWPCDPPASPAASIATLVSRLRRTLGQKVVDGDREGYRLGRSPFVEVDLDEAGRWLEEAEHRVAAGEPGLALAAATRADDVLGAEEVLSDEPAADWAEPARLEAADLRLRCLRVTADAALGAGDHVLAAKSATALVAADCFDEPAVRVLMRAQVAAGEPARALAVYAELQQVLADALGADPATATRELHLAALRDDDLHPTGAEQTVRLEASGDTIGLVGRAEPLRDLRAEWNGAAAGHPGLTLVAGEAGIGKTRLMDELIKIASTTGGTVLASRCYDAERSLFLQPVVEAVSNVVATLPPQRLLALVGDHAASLARLVPEVGPTLAPAPSRRDNADLERRRAFEALADLITGLAEPGPVLLAFDDLQNAGRSTIEFIHFLMRRAPRARLLVVATVRVEEGGEVLESLVDRGRRLDLGALSQDAVARLAAAAGRPDEADEVMRRTRGHSLFVVETLRALNAGTAGIPESLEAAVLARVHRAGPAVDELLRAAAVLGVSFDLTTVAGLLGESVQQVMSACREALAARLIVVAGREYEFANDLVRDVLYATTPTPTNHSRHLLAADLLTARPEAVAMHASAAADWPRAARAWLLAAEVALAKAAAADAVVLVTRALDVADRIGDLDVRARALVTRTRARAALADYSLAYLDAEQAVAAAHEAGDQRLEVVALRELGGEVPSALGRPVPECVGYLERGLVLAASLSDRAMEANLRAWMAVLAANDLRFDDSVRHGHLAVVAARTSGDAEALVAALDGQKTSLAYLGEVGPLAVVVAELEPLLRQQGDLFRLHWTVFESSFVSVAAGDWSAAAALMEAALDINARSGFSAYASWHLAHLGWLARQVGDYDRALELGGQAWGHRHGTPHIWCTATAGAILGATLLEVGDSARAIEVLEEAEYAARRSGADAYLLRALAPLAEATGRREVLDEADDLLRRIATPDGSAFLAGDACYLAVARAWLRHDEPARAREALRPVLAAAERVPWVGPLADASLVDGVAAGRLGESAESAKLLDRADDLAKRHGLPRVAREVAAAR